MPDGLPGKPITNPRARFAYRIRATLRRTMSRENNPSSGWQPWDRLEQRPGHRSSRWVPSTYLPPKTPR